MLALLLPASAMARSRRRRWRWSVTLTSEHGGGGEHDLAKYAAASTRTTTRASTASSGSATPRVVTRQAPGREGQPAGDVVWGLVATSLYGAQREGSSSPTRRGYGEARRAVPRQGESPREWVGMDAGWRRDLLQHRRGQEAEPARAGSSEGPSRSPYRGQVAMPNPASSGTGSSTCRAGCRSSGSRGGRSSMRCTRTRPTSHASGLRRARWPRRASPRRRRVLRLPRRAAQEQGAPIDIIFPEEKSGWDMETDRPSSRAPRPSTSRGRSSTGR